MRLPIRDLAEDRQRIPRPVGCREVSREFLVREVGVVLERTRRLDDVDAAAALAPCKLGTPGRGVERRREIDVLELPVDEVAAEAGAELVADVEVGFGAVIEDRAGRDVFGIWQGRLLSLARP
jgi:hypothetical protein